MAQRNPTREDVRGMFTLASHQARIDNQLRGYLGLPLGNNQYQFTVPGESNKVYCRVFRGSTMAIEAVVNMGAPLDPRIEVLLERDAAGNLFVVMANPTQSAVSRNNLAPSTTGPHSHAIGSGNEDYVEGLRLLPGLVQAFSGLTVSFNGFAYPAPDGSVAWHADQTLDISGAVPGSANQQRFAIIDLVRETDTLEVTNGTIYSTAYPNLDEEEAVLDIPAGTYPLVGIVLAYGATGITDYRSQVFDLRLWLGYAGFVKSDQLLLTELSGAPATPDTGQWKLYFKSDGLYTIDDAGAETGPIT